jgi:glycosyltransferase involved in cell wall biosynthesis
MNGFSLVLCTYNGKSKLGPTLAHLAALIIPEDHAVELIVVDNGSSDDTARFVQQEWTELGSPFPLRLLQENRPGKGYAVETGYDAAQYTYILTVDDDNWLSADYLVTAVDLFRQHPDVGVLQGRSIGEFEEEPPQWAIDLQPLFVIGSPVRESGYFPKHYYAVWGAGMVILNEDWKRLRAMGFTFLTSKVPGKAAGEDHETAIGLLLLGRRIYYSEKLTYKHFMPADRISWEKLRTGFKLWAYLMYYNMLYSLVIEAHRNKDVLTKRKINKAVFAYFKKVVSGYTVKQHVAYWIKPGKEFYQLRIYRDLSYFRWCYKLSNTTWDNIKILQNWIEPLMDENPNSFKMHFL